MEEDFAAALFAQGHTQLGRVFVNEPSRVRPAYREYLVRSLRAKLGLEGAPVALEFRPRRDRRRS